MLHPSRAGTLCLFTTVRVRFEAKLDPWCDTLAWPWADRTRNKDMIHVVHLIGTNLQFTWRP